MEHIPASHAAKVGMRYPARITAFGIGYIAVDLDLSALAPGRAPWLGATLYFHQTVSADVARALRVVDRFEVVLVVSTPDNTRCVSLPADPDWLTWNGGTVRQLARQVLAAGETALLPILADALEEAGCTERALLARCREPEDDDLYWLVTLLATQE